MRFRVCFLPRYCLSGTAIVVAACATAPPRVNGAASVPASPASLWVPPAHAVKTEAPLPPLIAEIPSDLGQRVRNLTLGDVVDLALRNNPATRISWAQARAAADVYGSERGQFFPTITGDVSGSRSRSISINGAAINRTQYGPSLALSYLLLDFGARSGSIEEARQNLFAADLSHNATLQTTVLQAETAYFTYMATRALLGAEQSAIAEAQANLAAANQRHSVGLATIADVLQARTALSQEELNLETVQGNLQTVRGSLAAAMGLPANLPYDLEVTPETTAVGMVSEAVDSIINQAVRNRPDLAAARAQAAAAAAQVRVTRSAEFPSLVLGSNAARSYTVPAIYGGTSYGLSLGISIPIFNGFSNQYNVASSQAQAEAASARADLTRQEIITQVFTSYYALQTAAQRVTTADALLASALESEQVAAGRYREGVGSIIDLLTAETALANARAQQVQSRWQWSTALAQLAHDAGVIGLHGENPLPVTPGVAAPPFPPPAAPLPNVPHK